MNIVKLILALPILPFAWISSLIYKNKSTLQAQVRLEKWSRFILKYLGYTLAVKGKDNVPVNETVYFVCNHQGTLDPALILASSPVHLAFISKKENEKMPIFGRWACNIGTIHFDRNSREGNVHMLRETIRELKQGKNLLIFPEGTRSKGNSMHDFKAGALMPAYMAKATIVPIVINHSYALDVKDKIKHLSIEYGKPLRHEDYKSIKQEELAIKLHDWILERIDTSPLDK